MKFFFSFSKGGGGQHQDRRTARLPSQGAPNSLHRVEQGRRVCGPHLDKNENPPCLRSPVQPAAIFSVAVVPPVVPRDVPAVIAPSTSVHPTVQACLGPSYNHPPVFLLGLVRFLSSGVHLNSSLWFHFNETLTSLGVSTSVAKTC